MRSKIALIKSAPLQGLDWVVCAFLIGTGVAMAASSFDMAGLPQGLDLFDFAKLGLLFLTKLGLGLALGAGLFCLFQSFLRDPRFNMNRIQEVWTDLATSFKSIFSRPPAGQFRPPRSIN